MFRTLKPEKVYVTEDVDKDARATACVDRLMTAIEGAHAERVSYAELNEMALTRWQNIVNWGRVKDPRDPDLVMTTAKFYTEKEKESSENAIPIWAFETCGGSKP